MQNYISSVVFLFLSFLFFFLRKIWKIRSNYCTIIEIIVYTWIKIAKLYSFCFFCCFYRYKIWKIKIIALLTIVCDLNIFSFYFSFVNKSYWSNKNCKIIFLVTFFIFIDIKTTIATINEIIVYLNIFSFYFS